MYNKDMSEIVDVCLKRSIQLNRNSINLENLVSDIWFSVYKQKWQIFYKRGMGSTTNQYIILMLLFMFDWLNQQVLCSLHQYLFYQKVDEPNFSTSIRCRPIIWSNPQFHGVIDIKARKDVMTLQTIAKFLKYKNLDLKMQEFKHCMSFLL